MLELELGGEELALIENEEFDMSEIHQVMECMDIDEWAAKLYLRAKSRNAMRSLNNKLVLCV